ncbi:hypothetical protein KAM471c_25690 [Aeromonas caviae]|nr:hypothetical protein KAM329_027120 [Aeromonas caviae]BDN88754.1 hypothetical protein KAM471c_25690 [Aeromonas caviae]BDN92924.1 hypothetical protein KAM497c_24680 [Aeromonas caviae]GJA11123.1 hypothetical protein KAM334_24340 [Aeromonas caviae]GJB02919.1 hypothetical protein KAM360_18620 [Aeromonas caviae]
MGRVSGLGKDDPRLGPFFIPFKQDAGAAIARLQDAGQQQGGDLFKGLDHFAGRETAPLGGTTEERRAETPGDQWQAGGESILTVGHPVKAGQKDQALQQFIYMAGFCLHSIPSNMIQKVVSGPNIQSPAAIRKNRTDLATQTHNPISAQSRDTACLASLTDFHAGNGGDMPGT